MVTLDVILSLTLVQRSVRKIVNSNLQLVKSSQKTLQDDVLKLLWKGMILLSNVQRLLLIHSMVLILSPGVYAHKGSLSAYFGRTSNVSSLPQSQSCDETCTDFLGRKLHWSLFILNILMFVRKTHSDVICWKNIFRLLMNHKILSKADKVFTPQLDK